MKRNYFTVNQLAEETGMAAKSIYRLCEQRKIPHIRIGAKLLFQPDIIRQLTIQPLNLSKDDYKSQ